MVIFISIFILSLIGFILFGYIEYKRQLIEQVALKSSQEAKKYLEEHKEELLQQAYNETQEYIDKCEYQKEILDQEIADLQYNLLKLEADQAAVIKRKKDSLAVAENVKYYKINLKPTDARDIQIMMSIESQLVNKEALNKLVYEVFIKQPMNEMFNRVLDGKDICGIYKITNINDQKVYIGQSVNIKRRWTSHIKAAYNIGDIAHQKVHDVMREEGIDNFTFEVIEETTKDKLNEREKYWIEYYKSYDYGYNQTKGNK